MFHNKLFTFSLSVFTTFFVFFKCCADHFADDDVYDQFRQHCVLWSPWKNRASWSVVVHLGEEAVSSFGLYHSIFLSKHFFFLRKNNPLFCLPCLAGDQRDRRFHWNGSVVNL